MATKSTIRLGLSSMSNSALQNFVQYILLMMTANISYPSPLPPLLTIQSLLTDFINALSAWGTWPGNRGSTAQKVALDNARAALETGITQLALYCENTTPYDAAALVSGGWNLKSPPTPVGLIGPVRDIVSLEGDDVGFGEVVLEWKKPLGVSVSNINAYNVFRALTSNLASAVWVATVTRSRFKETGLTGSAYFYWIVPIGSAGYGTVSDVCVAYVTQSV